VLVPTRHLKSTPFDYGTGSSCLIARRFKQQKRVTLKDDLDMVRQRDGGSGVLTFSKLIISVVNDIVFRELPITTTTVSPSPTKTAKSQRN